MIDDMSIDLTKYNELITNTSNMFNILKELGLIILIVILIFIPLFLYLKYRMEIRIVKKGTLQALNEFYKTNNINNTNNNNSNINTNNDNNYNNTNVVTNTETNPVQDEVLL